jgi:hypothetical protein
MPLGDTKGCQPGTENIPRWLSEAIRSMCGGRNPPNKKLSRLYEAPFLTERRFFIARVPDVTTHTSHPHERSEYHPSEHNDP